MAAHHWRDEIHLDALDVSRTASSDLRSRYQEGLVVFNVIRHGIPMPDAKGRAKCLWPG